MSSQTNYEAMKVGQLRALCKLRGLSSDERKEDLIASLIKLDSNLLVQTPSPDEPMIQAAINHTENQLTAEELREIATITDEMKHLRKQWLLQCSRQQTQQTTSNSFVHQGYGTSRR